MSKTEIEWIDAFKKALGETTRSIAEDPELSVRFAADRPGLHDTTIQLPHLGPRSTQQSISVTRGLADSFALQRKFQDLKTFEKYLPSGETAREIYKSMELARCEARGMNSMPGVATNLHAKIEDSAKRNGYGDATNRADVPLSHAAGYWVRTMATGRELPSPASDVLELWKEFIESKVGVPTSEMESVLDDQSEFAKFARRVIGELGYADQLGDNPDSDSEDPEENEGEGEDSGDQLDDIGNDQQDSEEHGSSSEHAADDFDEADSQPMDSDSEDFRPGKLRFKPDLKNRLETSNPRPTPKPTRLTKFTRWNSTRKFDPRILRKR